MRHTSVINTIFILFTTIFVSTHINAKEYYKWVDTNGTTHYTTTPPPKNAKKKGKVDTYGYQVTGISNNATTTQTPNQEPSNTPSPVVPIENPPTNATNTK